MMVVTYKFLRWMHSTRRMDEEVVTSEKCWSGIEEKRRELDELFENCTCLKRSGGKFGQVIRRS